MNSIYLKGGSYYVTPNNTDAYRVLSGSVLVYIVPWKKQEIGRRSLLCEVQEGNLIPSFAYRDMDYQQWRFCFVAVEEAALEQMPDMCTMPLRKKFLRHAGVTNFEQEGYENALVDCYRMNLVREDGYFIRTDIEKKETQARTNRLITSLFEKQAASELQKGDLALYQVVSLLCHKAKIPIAPYERIKSCCGQKATVLDIARISHFPCREVVLEEKWHTADAGSLLVFMGEEREPAACVPNGQHGYTLYRNGQKPVKLTKKLSEQCNPKAYMIYRPFPQKSLTPKGFAKYCVQGLSKADLFSVLLLTVVSSLIGLLLPTLNQKLYDEFIPMGETSLIVQFGCLIAAFMSGNILFSIIKNLGAFRLSSRIRYQVQNAVYHRVFELPENFFRNYESADLAGRIMELGSLAGQVADLVLSLFLSTVTAVFYLVRMFTYSAKLSAVSLLMMLVFAVIIYILARSQMKYQEEAMALEGKSDSVMYQFLNGIDKIRIAGIEDRAIYEYMKPFVDQRKLQTSMGRLAGISGAVSTISGSIFTMVIYAMVYKSSGISMGQFVAFNSAFGMVSGTVNELTNGLVSYKLLQPAYDRIREVLETEPETNEGKRLPGDITGCIDVDHVAFSYSEDTPPVFQDLSLHIKAGEYIGIVGSSGCGKSTLLKLLLGFEQPNSGRIYFDDQDMSELDLQELRKKFGVVLQDGELISGSIFDNIALTAPWANHEDVEKVVAAVGLQKDIEGMPMGLQTIVSENCNTISGGQKQRILIARAIINRPKIIFFDEATSALDNITQSMVCDTLEKMDSTRLIIAHRLSTIQKCDRILVFDHGDVVEEGNYETLMAQKGPFYQLASRQLIDG